MKKVVFVCLAVLLVPALAQAALPGVKIEGELQVPAGGRGD